jgi:hypothetical protein
VLTIAIVAALGWAAYKFLKFNTAVGAETVRAYLYLESMLHGGSAAEAADLVSRDMLTLEPSALQKITNNIQTAHGKQLPLIAEAYRRGMRPELAGWHRTFASNAPALHSVSTRYTTPLSMKERESRTGSQGAKEDRSPHTPLVSKPARAFDEYYQELLAELKRLSGKQYTELHPIELMDTEPLERAFSDGVHPKSLAAMLHGEFSAGR